MAVEAVERVGNWIQIANLVMAAAILALTVLAGWRWKQARLILFGLVTYAAHSVVFYGVVVVLGGLPAPWGVFWSAVLRFHSYAFILATIAVLYIVALSPEWAGYER